MVNILIGKITGYNKLLTISWTFLVAQNQNNIITKTEKNLPVKYTYVDLFSNS